MKQVNFISALAYLLFYIAEYRKAGALYKKSLRISEGVLGEEHTEIIAAEKKGCLVLTYNKAKQVWIDNAINTLITPADNQDDGWKKIRRVKTRFELIRRINTTTDDLVGKVDNDRNGRATVISQIQGVGDSMKEEGKLVSCSVNESRTWTQIYDANSGTIEAAARAHGKNSSDHGYWIWPGTVLTIPG